MGSQSESKRVAKCSKVRHQRLCLAVDMADQRLLGHSELSVVNPAANEPRVVGLNAKGLDILRVTVNGVPARFTLGERAGPSGSRKERSSQAWQLLKNMRSSPSEELLKSNVDAADVAYREYEQSLANELFPELLVQLPDPLPRLQGRIGSCSADGGGSGGGGRPSLSGRSSDVVAGIVGTPSESGGSLCGDDTLLIAVAPVMTSVPVPVSNASPSEEDGRRPSGSPCSIVGKGGCSLHEARGSNGDGRKEDGIVEELVLGLEACELLENASEGHNIGYAADVIGDAEKSAGAALPSSDSRQQVQASFPASDTQGTQGSLEGGEPMLLDAREAIGTQASNVGCGDNGSSMLGIEASAAKGTPIGHSVIDREGMTSVCSGQNVSGVGGLWREDGGGTYPGRLDEEVAIRHQAAEAGNPMQGPGGGESAQHLHPGTVCREAVLAEAASDGPIVIPSGEKNTEARERTNTCKDAHPAGNNAAAPHAGKSEGATEEVVQIWVDYKVEKPQAGVFFSGGVLHTDNQLNRARCWFPCIDSSSECCSFDLEFTVDAHLCAVSNGELLYQVYDGINEQQKTYVYKLQAPTAACNICLVVAPLVILPDRHNSSITHMCMPGRLQELKHTISFMNSVFSCYEEFLGTSFPYGSYKQVFIDAEDTISSCQVFASVTMISSHLLIDERVIDKTVDARCKLAHALSQQWFGQFIAPETPSDAWLVEGLAAFLTDVFVRRAFGNNEVAYWRHKANQAVCQSDIEGFPPLSISAAAASEEKLSAELLEHKRMRSWKAVGIIGMLEKQMGSDQFRKVMQKVVRGRDPSRQQRTLSVKDFRHIANKTGGLDRPFLKTFFFRWVDCPGCPRLRAAFAYNRRRNVVELAVKREATAPRDANMLLNRDLVKQAGGDDAELGWPGMMTVRLYELDGMFDHPRVPMMGDTCQLVEIQCHSKLTSRRVTKKKPTRVGGDAEENGDSRGTGVGPQNTDTKQSTESPLLWVRVDPESEWLVQLELHQPEHMWINQLEKERDVVGQLQAINGLRSMANLSFAAVNALSTCLTDPKIYCRVRMEAAYALGDAANEATNWSGLSLLIKFYKDRYYDPDTCMPRPNNFRDFAEYFVNQAVVGAVASVQGNDGTSPVEAVDFLVELLKYNDNSLNPFLDAHWLAVVIEAIGGLKFGEQNVHQLPRVLKQIDRYLQFDRLLPSYQHLVSASCLWALSALCQKLPKNQEARDRLIELLRSHTQPPNPWRVRLAAFTSLMDLEVQSKGLDMALASALHASVEDRSIRVSSKLLVHLLECCKQLQAQGQPMAVSIGTRSLLLRLMSSERAFKVASFRHRVFLLLQILGNRYLALIRPFVAKQETGRTSKKADDPVKTSKQDEQLDVLHVQQGSLPTFRKEIKGLSVKIPAASGSTPKMTPSSNPKSTMSSAAKSSLVATVKPLITPCQKPEKFVIKLINPMAKSSTDAASGASTGSQPKKDMEAEESQSQGHRVSKGSRGDFSRALDTESGECTNPESGSGVEPHERNKSVRSPITTGKRYGEGEPADGGSQNGGFKESRRLSREREEDFSTRESLGMHLGDWSKKGRRSTMKAKRADRLPIEKGMSQLEQGLVVERGRQEYAKGDTVADRQSGMDGSQGRSENKVRLPRWTYDSVKFELDLEGDRWQEMQGPYMPSSHYSTIGIQPWVSRGDVYADKGWVRKHSESSSGTETSSEEKGVLDGDSQLRQKCSENRGVGMAAGRERWLKPRRVTKLGSAGWAKPSSGVRMLHSVDGFNRNFQGSYCGDQGFVCCDEKLMDEGLAASQNFSCERRGKSSPLAKESTWEGARRAGGKESDGEQVWTGGSLEKSVVGHMRDTEELPRQRELKVNGGPKDGGFEGTELEDRKDWEVLVNKVGNACAEENKRWFGFLGNLNRPITQKDRIDRPPHTRENTDLEPGEWRGESEEAGAGMMTKEEILRQPQKRWFHNVGVQRESRNAEYVEQERGKGLKDVAQGTSHDTHGSKFQQGSFSRLWAGEGQQEGLDVSHGSFCWSDRGGERTGTSEAFDEWREGGQKTTRALVFKQEVLEDLGSNSKDAREAQRKSWEYRNSETETGIDSDTRDGETQGSKGNKIILRVDTRDKRSLRRAERKTRSCSWDVEEESLQREINEEGSNGYDPQRQHHRLIRAVDGERVGGMHVLEEAGSEKKGSRESSMKTDEEESVKIAKRGKERRSSRRRESETERFSKLKEQVAEEGMFSDGTVGGAGLPPHTSTHSTKDIEIHRPAKVVVVDRKRVQKQVLTIEQQKKSHVPELTKRHGDELGTSISCSQNTFLNRAWATQDVGASISRTDERPLLETATNTYGHSGGPGVEASKGCQLKVKLPVGSLRSQNEMVTEHRKRARVADEEDNGDPRSTPYSRDRGRSSTKVKLAVKAPAKDPAQDRRAMGIDIQEPAQRRNGEVGECVVRQHDGKHVPASLDSERTLYEGEATTAQQKGSREPELESSAAQKGALKFTLKIKTPGGGSSDRKLTLVPTPNGSQPYNRRTESEDVKNRVKKSEERGSGLEMGFNGRKVKTVGSLMADNKTMLGGGENSFLEWGEEGTFEGRDRGGPNSSELAEGGSRHHKCDGGEWAPLPNRVGQGAEVGELVAREKGKQHRRFGEKEKQRTGKEARRGVHRKGGSEKDCENRAQWRKRGREGDMVVSSEEGLRLVIKRPKHS